MISGFALLLDRCSLSHQEAADMLDVRLDTVRSWASGRRSVPASAIARLRDLYRRIERCAATLDGLRPFEQDADDDLAVESAHAAGLDRLGPYRAALGIAFARGDGGGAATGPDVSDRPMSRDEARSGHVGQAAPRRAR